ncbi:MAG: Mpo1-like protein [Pseudomonadota bacterium]
MTSATHTDTETPQGTRRVDELLAHYGESHQNPGNEVIHFIAIPLIMLSLVGMLFALHPWVAYAFVAASMVYYARLSVVFLITMAVISALAFVIIFAMGRHVLPVSVAIFVGAWIMQFIGHKMEGKKPSFFEDLQYLWVGPLFVLSKLFIKLGVRW